MRFSPGARAALPTAALDLAGAVRLSKDDIRKRKAVPTFPQTGKEFRQCVYSLSWRGTIFESPSGDFSTVIPATYRAAQFVALLAAGAAAGNIILVPYILITQSMNWNLAGILWLGSSAIAALFSKRLIRRHPWALMSYEAAEELIMADSGRVRLPLAAVRQLLVIQGQNYFDVPAQGPLIHAEDYNPAVLAAEGDAPDGKNIVLLQRFAYPAGPVLAAARLAAKKLDIPLEILKFS